MPWKMFCRCEHRALMRALDVSGYVIPDLLRILAKRTRVDNWVRRIGIDVRIRKEIPLHANRAGLKRSNASELLGVFGLAGCAERHGMRKNRSSVEPHRNSALKISCNNQGQLRILLQPIQQLRCFIRLVLEEERTVGRNRHPERPNVILAYVVAELKPHRIGFVHELHFHPDHEQLPDFFLRRHPAQRLFRPLAPVAIQMNGPLGLVAFLRSSPPSRVSRRKQKRRQRRYQKPHPRSPRPHEKSHHAQTPRTQFTTGSPTHPSPCRSDSSWPASGEPFLGQALSSPPSRARDAPRLAALPPAGALDESAAKPGRRLRLYRESVLPRRSSGSTPATGGLPRSAQAPADRSPPRQPPSRRPSATPMPIPHAAVRPPEQTALAAPDRTPPQRHPAPNSASRSPASRAPKPKPEPARAPPRSPALLQELAPPLPTAKSRRASVLV